MLSDLLISRSAVQEEEDFVMCSARDLILLLKQEVQEADVLFEDDPSRSGKKEKEDLPSLPEREPSAAGMPLGALGTAPSETIAFNRQPSWAIPRTDSKGNVLNVAAMKRRGLRAASFHKTSVDALLHPRYAGATPYRIVLGEVRQRLVSTRRRMEAILAGVKVGFHQRPPWKMCWKLNGTQ